MNIRFVGSILRSSFASEEEFDFFLFLLPRHCLVQINSLTESKDKVISIYTFDSHFEFADWYSQDYLFFVVNKG